MRISVPHPILLNLAGELMMLNHLMQADIFMMQLLRAAGIISESKISIRKFTSLQTCRRTGLP
jgi:hypothetical protein